MREGSTTDRTPAALTPTSGTVVEELLPTTVARAENPFQIHEITLTPEQAAQERFHLAWEGTGDERRVSAHVWDHDAGAWVLKDSGADAAGGTVALDVEALRSEGAVSPEGTLHLLVWRGLTSEPFGEDHRYEADPDPADFDFSMEHVPDTQLYAQATPQMFTDQMSWVVERAQERRTAMVVHAGDLVNRKYLSQEYQWQGAEDAMGLLDDAEIPYLVSWGNHDYENDRNNRVMLQRYYPAQRFADSLEGSPWTFGGSHGVDALQDNYFYTADLDGAKVLLLTVGFFSADNPDDPGLAWAEEVIRSHPEHAVILAIHQSVDTGANRWANENVTSRLIDPHSNVRLVLGGHITGTGVAHRPGADGAPVYGILTDYQGRTYGGQQFLRSLAFDTENGLLHASTYSPYLDARTSDGPWRQEIPAGAIPGFHGSDSENFVLELDLGVDDERTLATSALTVAAGESTVVGPVQAAVGAERVEAVLGDLEPGRSYGWYVEVRDGAGHVTRSPVSPVTTAPSDVSSPFVDVPVDSLFFPEIAWLFEHGISRGWVAADGTREFRPVTPIARDAMAAFLFRLAEVAGQVEGYVAPTTSPFSDVGVDDEFYTEIAWLHAEGIATGWDAGDGTAQFRPLAPIGRDAMAAFLYRMAGEPSHTAPATSPFTDVTPSTQFYDEITWLVDEGIATGWVGNDGTAQYQPVAPINRDAMAAFLQRYVAAGHADGGAQEG
ncbi:metallophosphoesterase [Litorihabitans aurantiacus]|uniref:SLH domain-containing protein n=1 Tax=Litorihabitans aurantiacus TaxID=1930061 RepID=A0AA37UP17_9MICO|nr:metallophosphoesterase [Litorihabitans aurantiacus]GMA30533.1 hypothetical protein GCM10025875_05250 [Litorihabitans aurantiacus]